MVREVDLLVHGIAELLTPPDEQRPLAGPRQGELLSIKDAALAVDGGRVAALGPERELRAAFRAREQHDAEDRIVTPGLVDPHTHLVYSGDRSGEHYRRLAGESYLDIAAAGGGINATVRALRAADADTLYALALPRLRRSLRHGCTALEIKSGYGLDTDSELKQLKVIRRLAETVPQRIVATFLGAHDIPDEHRCDPEAYVRLIIEEMLPRVAEERLARYCDAFVEQGVFTVEQARRILTRARALGLAPKLHADEIHPTGGAELAAELGAASADHLVAASDEGLRALARAGTVAVLLPATGFHLRQARAARARDMIALGLPLAIATDANPGSSGTESMTMALYLGCRDLSLSPAEALVAATHNAAAAIGLAGSAGALASGRPADFVLWDAGSLGQLCSRFGASLADRVYVRGELVLDHQAGYLPAHLPLNSLERT